MELATIFGVMAALLHGTSYFLYNLQAKSGKSTPNIASWGIWVFLAALNAFSFREMSGNTVLALQFFTGSGACALTFLYVLSIGKFARPKPREAVVLALGLFSAAVWWIFRSAAGANMIVLLALIISFFPTWEGVWRDPYKETPLTWVLWTAAYGFTIIAVIIKHGQLLSFFTPVACLIMHGAVAILSTEKRKTRFRLKPGRAEA
ncbi:hypothetical protein A2303_04575 [Candidatus Falkowbacteria bacterium RIFOXYB2_FULL_47_14]|uniref:Uncharacterized protein n=1 Tax=Candidatus Falkowbacteria bacterium RIFOXYA2_FULL_47_19 TaxID=1797994 RepID=A0A1F5SH47_9BACT|nr:MAG: hypothetical protein A2227_02410 [Candidatus Falkowbacteria bacterium RIFOXYA2_FULL_47_19]OGF34847.1 MAG: hypothetical protein A2468_00815 [Candidatus Falkowbacteria bacterium RIFOXYC2_FULL_46_15]OGF42650.1 MAG: hypothetical protein A2303_04575 [Candidatus Falkowbacteria bacterium RIFOXYB2_FULL_47_14]